MSEQNGVAELAVAMREALLRAVDVRFSHTDAWASRLVETIATETDPQRLLSWLEKLATYQTPSLVVAVLGENPTQQVNKSLDQTRPSRTDKDLPIEFHENQQRIKPETLLPYAGQLIAWSWDGSRIVTSAPDWESMFRKVKELGLDSQRLCFDYVDPL